MIENFNSKETFSKISNIIMNRICGTSDIMTVIYGHKCEFDFKVLPIDSTASIGYDERDKFFDEEFTVEVLKRIKGSMAVYFWNAKQNEVRFKKNAETAFMNLATNYCPRTTEKVMTVLEAKSFWSW